MTSSETSEGPRPGIVHIHGGGMFAGDVYLGTDAKWATDFDAVTIMVDYRLAPEAQDLALVEDCYAALLWVGEHLSELNIDPARLLLEGGSAGGALAAGAALMTRDKGGPQLCGLLLRCPMLDDRNNSTSCRQYWDSGTFTGATNQFAWKCVLGDRAGGDGVSYYVSPGRATDLSGLPETYIDVGSAEPFRDSAAHNSIQSKSTLQLGLP
ncbi:Alpha/Beta hydrolase protein [Diaporthe sp. PMI_573]|nr:Alpha/Beta hydrolase protein [Diaporthaceae sp. PMI_573]